MSSTPDRLLPDGAPRRSGLPSRLGAGRVLLALIATLVTVFALPALAQTVTVDVTAQVSTIDAATKTLAGLNPHAGLGKLGDAELKSRLAALPPVRTDLENALAVLRPAEAAVDDRLDQLGAPAAHEAPQTHDERQALTRQRQSLDTQIKQADLLIVEADQLRSTLADQLRDNFEIRLWSRERSLLDPGLWAAFLAEAPEDGARFDHALDEETSLLAAHPAPARTALIVLAVLAILAILPVRWLARRAVERRFRRGTPDPLTRATLALGLILAAAAPVVIGGLIAQGALGGADALTERADVGLSMLIRVAVFAAVLESLGRALLARSAPAWRMAPLPDAVARRLSPFPGLIGLAAALATLASGLNSLLGAGLAGAVTVDCLTLLLEAGAVGAGLLALARARHEHAEESETEPHAARWAWVLSVLAAWIAVIAAVVATLAGYLALGAFLMRETVWIGLVLGVLAILLRIVDDALPAVIAPDSRLGRALHTGVGLSTRSLDQIGVLAAGLVRVLLLLFGGSTILAPFGAGVEDIITRVTSQSVVFHLGQVTISPGAILGAVFMLFLGLFVTRAVRGWLENRYLPRTSLDIGLRASATAAVTYFGVVSATLFAFAYLGLSLSQITLFASALSVGIGFGLQPVIGNFVSGLIILAEQRLKVGDLVAIGDQEGDIRKVSLRATEIEMLDRSKLIVPNSELITKAVRNLTHGEAQGRVRILLRIEPDADPHAVRALLLEKLKAHKRILARPEPAVHINDIKDGAVEYLAIGFVPSPRLAFGVKSELLFEILPALKAAGITLASQPPLAR